MLQTVLILGGTGRFGRNATQAFEAAGWDVRQFDRKVDDLETAARGADVIVAGWNPSYDRWATEVPKLHASIRRAALANDCTVLIPGNVYVFGAQTPSPWGETSPHAAQNLLGVIRRDMEAAYRSDGVKTIVLRAGDFIDTQASGNWFDKIMTPTLPKGALTYPGHVDIEHAWAYLPDVARAAVALAEKREGLARFEDVNFAGYTLSGEQMAEALARALGKPITTKPVAWWMMRLAWPFMPIMKHLFEMRYLWNTPHRLSGEKMEALLPDFVLTPLSEALLSALPEAQVNPDKPMPAGSLGKRVA